MQVSGLARIVGVGSDKIWVSDLMENVGLRSDEMCGSQVGPKMWVSGRTTNVGLGFDAKRGSPFQACMKIHAFFSIS